MEIERWVVTEGIPGIASKGEIIVSDPDNPGIAVGRWIPWDRLEYIRGHEPSSLSRLTPDGATCQEHPQALSRLRVI